MFEKTARLPGGGDQSMVEGNTRDEPSHIHIPRPSRLARAAATGSAASWFQSSANTEGLSVVVPEAEEQALEAEDPRVFGSHFVKDRQCAGAHC